jgi:8-oxo-dGTP diphosphatase
MQHRISAGALVEHEGRMLVVRHVRAHKYDFWVAPGGGVQGTEALAIAAAREVREESGLEVEPGSLLYIEELTQPGLRHCKFWFGARLLGGKLSTGSPEARAEYIAEAAWLLPSELKDRTVFPPVLNGQYWKDRPRHAQGPIHLGLRQMQFW